MARPLRGGGGGEGPGHQEKKKNVPKRRGEKKPGKGKRKSSLQYISKPKIIRQSWINTFNHNFFLYDKYSTVKSMAILMK